VVDGTAHQDGGEPTSRQATRHIDLLLDSRPGIGLNVRDAVF
jgi:hypothetical protein